MNISRLGQPSGFGTGTPRAGKTDTRPTAAPKREGTAPVDGVGTSAPDSSARIAAFEESLSSRIDQMAASGKFSPRQLAALEGAKDQLSSMMARLDRAFFEDGSFDPQASDVLKHIMDVTSESLNAVLGQGPRTPGRLVGVQQHEFGYARDGVNAASGSVDKIA